MDNSKEKLDELEDNHLIEIAKKRVEKATFSNVITHEDLLKRYDIQEDEIDELIDEVELDYEIEEKIGEVDYKTFDEVRNDLGFEDGEI